MKKNKSSDWAGLLAMFVIGAALASVILLTREPSRDYLPGWRKTSTEVVEGMERVTYTADGHTLKMGGRFAVMSRSNVIYRGFSTDDVAVMKDPQGNIATVNLVTGSVTLFTIDEEMIKQLK